MKILKSKKDQVKLGQEVECVVTGFKGKVTSITEYAFGCRRIGVQPPVGTDGKIPDPMDIDEPQTKILDKKQIIKTEMSKPKFKFGQEVEDVISGYKGVLYGAVYFLNGCIRVGVQEKYDPERQREICAGRWFNQGQIKPVGKKIIKELDVDYSVRKTGGPIEKSHRPSKGSL